MLLARKICASLYLLVFASCSLAAVFTPAQTEAIESVVASYLEQHPERVVDAIRHAQEHEAAMLKKRAQDYLETHAKDLLELVRPYTKVVEGARVTVIEFMDYQCGHCRLMYETLQTLKASEPLNRAFVPLPILGPQSIKAATLALSAPTQEQFFAITHDVFGLPELSDQALKNIGKKYKISMLGDSELEKKLRAFYHWAMQLGIQGAPAVVVTDGVRSEIFFGRISEEVLQHSVTRLAASPGAPVVLAQTQVGP